MSSFDFSDPEQLKKAISAPVDDEDRSKRVEGWKQFITAAVEQMNAKPSVGQMLMAWGSQMAQPVRPGENRVTRASRALSAVDALSAEQRARGKELLNLGFQLREGEQRDRQLEETARGNRIRANTTAVTTAAETERARLDREARGEEAELDRASRERVAQATVSSAELRAKTEEEKRYHEIALAAATDANTGVVDTRKYSALMAQLRANGSGGRIPTATEALVMDISARVQEQNWDAASTKDQLIADFGPAQGMELFNRVAKEQGWEVATPQPAASAGGGEETAPKQQGNADFSSRGASLEELAKERKAREADAAAVQERNREVQVSAQVRKANNAELQSLIKETNTRVRAEDVTQDELLSLLSRVQALQEQFKEGSAPDRLLTQMALQLSEQLTGAKKGTVTPLEGG